MLLNSNMIPMASFKNSNVKNLKTVNSFYKKRATYLFGGKIAIAELSSYSNIVSLLFYFVLCKRTMFVKIKESKHKELRAQSIRGIRLDFFHCVHVTTQKSIKISRLCPLGFGSSFAILFLLLRMLF